MCTRPCYGSEGGGGGDDILVVCEWGLSRQLHVCVCARERLIQ